MENQKEKFVWVLLRLGMGWTFLWVFLDKTFGLGFSTVPEKAWIQGVSPTAGFLKFGTSGAFASFYQGLAGSAIVDWLFMTGSLLIGLAFILGVGVRAAALFGSLLMILIFTASSLPPENNPFLDDHIIYIFVMIGLALTSAGDWIGFGKWWGSTRLVRRFTFLK